MRKHRVLIIAGIIMIAAASSLAAYNVWDDYRAGTKAEEIAEQIAFDVSKEDEQPETEIDGDVYIGELDIPILDMKLPVMKQWSMEGMKIAPGRYYGDVCSRNLIICGHNYQSHFGPLSSLNPGDAVNFTDLRNHTYSFRVMDIEILPEDAIEEMKAGEWDLTLFTCTFDLSGRIAVRCEAYIS